MEGAPFLAYGPWTRYWEAQYACYLDGHGIGRHNMPVIGRHNMPVIGRHNMPVIGMGTVLAGTICQLSCKA